MKVVVTGGRKGEDRDLVNRTLSAVNSETTITELIHGDAKGFDRLSRDWARDNGIPVTAFPADWVTFGLFAGSIRNREMVNAKPDLLVAFPGAKGTADMVKACKQKKIPIRFAVLESSLF